MSLLKVSVPLTGFSQSGAWAESEAPVGTQGCSPLPPAHRKLELEDSWEWFSPGLCNRNRMGVTHASHVDNFQFKNISSWSRFKT